jgi:hypothetical protein
MLGEVHEPSDAVTVCASLSWFVQVTVVPTRTVKAAGSKTKLEIFTFAGFPAGVSCAAGTVVAAGGGVVAAGAGVAAWVGAGRAVGVAVAAGAQAETIKTTASPRLIIQFLIIFFLHFKTRVLAPQIRSRRALNSHPFKTRPGNFQIELFKDTHNPVIWFHFTCRHPPKPDIDWGN